MTEPISEPVRLDEHLTRKLHTCIEGTQEGPLESKSLSTLKN